MVKEGLNEYVKESLALLSALLVRDYKSDAKIGIKALEILGISNKWGQFQTGDFAQILSGVYKAGLRGGGR